MSFKPMTTKNAVVALNPSQLTDFVSANRGAARSELIDQLDLITMTHCLKTYKNNQTRVAQVLGINRGTLRKRMRDLGLMGKTF